MKRHCFDFEWRRHGHPLLFTELTRNYPIIQCDTAWFVGSDCFFTTTKPLQSSFFNRAETASFRRSRTDSFGSYPSPIAMFTFVQTNRAKGGIRRMAPLIKRMVQVSYLFVNRTMLLVMYVFVCGQEENSAFSCFYLFYTISLSLQIKFTHSTHHTVSTFFTGDLAVKKLSLSQQKG